jgi:hypothetical protein
MECDNLQNTKKRKINSKCVYKFIIAIIEFHQSSKKWLVEWSDKTRTWESYDFVKDLDIFQKFLSKMLTSRIEKFRTPCYIG